MVLTNDELAERLEKLVDARSMASVLQTLAEIAEAKAEHVRTNWQDKTLAKEWDKIGRRVSKLAFETHL